jgi:hypothetical protein
MIIVPARFDLMAAPMQNGITLSRLIFMTGSRN